MPSYRFGGLVLAFLKEGRSEESLESLEETLSQADRMPHPFFSASYKFAIKESLSSNKKSSTVDNVIYDPRLAELPVEERKRREAAAAGKPYRVPEWWRGEKTNYKVASSMMKTLPKKIGPVK